MRAPVTPGILIGVFEDDPLIRAGAGADELCALVAGQAIGLKLMRNSFYEEILVQDGHILEHVIPPRDLQGWQQLPVSAIANFHPVMVDSLALPEITHVFREHPYQRFPVVKDGALAGVLTRKEVEAAITEKRPPRLDTAVTCLPNTTIRELQSKLIESSSLMVILVEREGGKILGLVTLHDLLRAEAAYAKSGDDPS